MAVIKGYITSVDQVEQLRSGLAMYNEAMAGVQVSDKGWDLVQYPTRDRCTVV